MRSWSILWGPKGKTWFHMANWVLGGGRKPVVIVWNWYEQRNSLYAKLEKKCLITWHNLTSWLAAHRVWQLIRNPKTVPLVVTWADFVISHLLIKKNQIVNFGGFSCSIAEKFLKKSRRYDQWHSILHSAALVPSFAIERKLEKKEKKVNSMTPNLPKNALGRFTRSKKTKDG